MAKWTPRELVSKAALRAAQLGLKVFEAMWAMIVEQIEALERG